MKRIFFLLGSLIFLPMSVKAQQKEKAKKEEVDKTEIELVYNHYIQDGNNSAVTGGKGTEKLTVYGPSLKYTKTKTKHKFSFTLGTDVISSASTDKIDFVPSSASILDNRVYSNAFVERKWEKRRMAISGGMGLSMESDYFSLGSSIGFSKQDKKKLRTFTSQFQMFNDDLRWGRVSADHFKPVELIYPAELRNRDWYETTRRNSFNLKLGLVQVMNKRNMIGLFPEFSYQKGLLETPFHRVYFVDGTVGVEQLPERRYRSALAFKWNAFAGRAVIVKSGVQIYRDNFGIDAFSIESEVSVKLNPRLILKPKARFYAQSASSHFREFAQHQLSSEYHTSDFDLSKFTNTQIGLGIKSLALGQVGKRIYLNALVLSYNYMYRSNNLTAHILSLSIQSEFKKKKAQAKLIE